MQSTLKIALIAALPVEAVNLFLLSPPIDVGIGSDRSEKDPENRQENDEQDAQGEQVQSDVSQEGRSFHQSFLRRRRARMEATKSSISMTTLIAAA